MAQQQAHLGPVLGAANSAGLSGSTAGWLDLHFAVARPEYEAMLRAVGIRPGWRVLDAGCGGGSFVPLLAELVGPAGCIAALDLAPENIATVEGRAADWALPCPLEARVGAVTALPYADGQFDAVWCANAQQYLAPEALATALGEFRRVTRPGGLVAVKDYDAGHTLFAPGDPTAYARRYALGLADAPVRRGRLRGRELRRWLERAGLADVWQRTTLIERWAPLTPDQRAFYGSWLTYVETAQDRAELPPADLAFWRRQADPASADHLINHPDFYACEGNVLAVGSVPGGAA